MKDEEVSLDALWQSALSTGRSFSLEPLSGLPEPARRYLGHAIARGTKLASAVRLRMHGTIRLKGWLPFTAEQVIDWSRGMIWSAAVRMYGLPIRGSDRFLEGQGALRWKLLGLLPVMTASGPDIDRSAAGRLAAESVWLPSVLCGDDVSWIAEDRLHPRARLTIQGYTTDLTLAIDGEGRLETLHSERWGNPGSSRFESVDFGGSVEEEKTFSGYTIPTRLRIGWYFGTDRFESEGEFFRATIDDAVYR